MLGRAARRVNVAVPKVQVLIPRPIVAVLFLPFPQPFQKFCAALISSFDTNLLPLLIDAKQIFLAHQVRNNGHLGW